MAVAELMRCRKCGNWFEVRVGNEPKDHRCTKCHKKRGVL